MNSSNCVTLRLLVHPVDRHGTVQVSGRSRDGGSPQHGQHARRVAAAETGRPRGVRLDHAPTSPLHPPDVHDHRRRQIHLGVAEERADRRGCRFDLRRLRLPVARRAACDLPSADVGRERRHLAPEDEEAKLHLEHDRLAHEDGQLRRKHCERSHGRTPYFNDAKDP